jgi:hypothetical protein
MGGGERNLDELDLVCLCAALSCLSSGKALKIDVPTCHDPVDARYSACPDRMTVVGGDQGMSHRG